MNFVLKKIVPALTFLLIAACSITQPLVVLAPHGQILRGQVTASLNGGIFEATDGRLACNGTYDSLTTGVTVSFAVRCNDGRIGVGTAYRDAGGQSGTGTIKLSDGSEARFMFGIHARGV
jgi:hypothetical protein